MRWPFGVALAVIMGLAFAASICAGLFLVAFLAPRYVWMRWIQPWLWRAYSRPAPDVPVLPDHVRFTSFFPAGTSLKSGIEVHIGQFRAGEVRSVLRLSSAVRVVIDIHKAYYPLPPRVRGVLRDDRPDPYVAFTQEP
jgi:hypothetical protein